MLNTISVSYTHLDVYKRQVLGGEREKEKTKESFKKIKGFVKSEVAKKIKIRKFPELIFEYDKTAEYALHIESLIASVSQKEEE